MTGPVYRSADGLMRSGDPAAVALWDDIGRRMAQESDDWTAILRAMGVKLAHPDDGWVKRELNKFTLSWYPQFDDRPEVSDLIAFGCPPRPTRWDSTGSHYEPSRVWDGRQFGKAIQSPEVAMSGYRICRVTEANRRASILGYHQDFVYEDTGVRMPPPASSRSRLKRWLGR